MNSIRKRWTDAEIVFELKDFYQGIKTVQQNTSVSMNVWEPEKIPDKEWDILFVDQLSVDPIEMKALKSQTKRYLISIDDAGAGHYEADFAFNSLYKCKTRKPVYGKTQSYWGFKYLILDPQFARQQFRVRNHVKQILITQGGADTYGILPKLVDSVIPWIENNTEVTLNVHTGPAFEHYTELERVLTKTDLKINCHSSIKNMASFLTQIDIAVTSVGMIACEIGAVGVPSILITGESKELETAQLFEDKGCAINLGQFSTDSTEMMQYYLNELSMKKEMRGLLSSNSQREMDGYGCERIMGLLESTIN